MNSMTTNVVAMTRNCTKMPRAGSMNCGRNAAKKRIPFGLVAAELVEQRAKAELRRGSRLDRHREALRYGDSLRLQVAVAGAGKWDAIEKALKFCRGMFETLETRPFLVRTDIH